MTIPNTVKIADLADLLGCTPRRIQQLASTGLLPKSERGLYPFRATLRAYLAYREGRGSSADEEADDASETAAKDKDRLLRARADKVEIEARILRRELVDKEEVRRGGEVMLVALHDRLLAIPNACAERAAEAAGLGGVRALAEVIREEIEGAMADLSGAEVRSIA